MDSQGLKVSGRKLDVGCFGGWSGERGRGEGVGRLREGVSVLLCVVPQPGGQRVPSNTWFVSYPAGVPWNLEVS